MFKRVRWMGMGAVAGVGASAWAQRRLRQTLQDHPSIRSGVGLASAARRVGGELGAALADGREAMTEREATLRTRLDPSSGPAADEVRIGATAGRSGAGRRATGRPELRIVDATSTPPRPRRLGT
jgi:hypothetical protein